MKRLMVAVLLAFGLHAGLFTLDLSFFGNNTLTRPKARVVTVTMSFRQPATPIPKKKVIPKKKQPEPVKKVIQPKPSPKKIDVPEKITQKPDTRKSVTDTSDQTIIREDVSGDSEEPSDQVMQEAVPLYRLNPPPEYPGKAKRRGWTGTVVLMVHVGKNGKVNNLWVFSSSGFMALDNAAINSVKTWGFDPGTKGGKPVDMWVKVPVTFELE